MCVQACVWVGAHMRTRVHVWCMGVYTIYVINYTYKLSMPVILTLSQM